MTYVVLVSGLPPRSQPGSASGSAESLDAQRPGAARMRQRSARAAPAPGDGSSGAAPAAPRWPGAPVSPHEPQSPLEKQVRRHCTRHADVLPVPGCGTSSKVSSMVHQLHAE